MYQKDSENGIFEFKTIAKLEGITPKRLNDTRYIPYEERIKNEKDLIALKIIKEIEENNLQIILAQRSVRNRKN